MWPIVVLGLVAIIAFSVVGMTNTILEHRRLTRAPHDNLLTKGELESMIERAVDRSIAPLQESVTHALNAPVQVPPETFHQKERE